MEVISMAEIELLLGHYCVGGKSAVGDIRRRYEDRARQGLLQSHLGPLVVGVVADGVGSADFGANAAQIAVDTVFTVLAESQAPTVPEMIDEAIRAANDAVNAQNAREEGDGQTTLVVAVVHQDRVYIGNVGDSRAYWVPASGKLVQITQDHTYYNKYGGDPNSEEAGTVVNAIGLRNKVGVDLGFYMNGEIQDRKRATSLGINGLPLKDGDSIMLCSDGLIKSDPSRQRYVTDEEIVDAIHSEFAPAAVVKMIGYAEGRKVDDNVSVVVIQRLSPQRIEQMASRKAAAKRRAQYRRLALSAAILLLLVGLGASISALLRSQKALSEAQNATPVVIQITNTPMPSPTPTKPIDPGKARVEQVNGEGSASFTAENGQAGVLIPGAYIDTGTVLTSANNGSVRV
ncbi:MAG: protein phosphatase 2C domain-containing protein, partial [Bellilinea sp.]|nr:protein phosphatase 2C domain-containing protein [Bellilinea sp.]